MGEEERDGISQHESYAGSSREAMGRAG